MEASVRVFATVFPGLKKKEADLRTYRKLSYGRLDVF